MQKQQLIEVVKRRTGNMGDHRKGSVELAISEMWQTAVGEIFKDKPSKLDNFSKRYVNVAVTYNSEIDGYESILPEEIIQTMDVQEGVRRINKMKVDDVDFVPMKGMEVGMFEHLDAGFITDTIGFIVKADRVEYFQMRDEIKKVKMDLVIPFEKWAMEDEFRIPTKIADYIIENAVRVLLKQPIIDRRKRNINEDEREIV